MLKPIALRQLTPDSTPSLRRSLFDNRSELYEPHEVYVSILMPITSVRWVDVKWFGQLGERRVCRCRPF